MLGEAILFASIQFAIGSVEMSSKFSVKNFSKDQETLQNAADALSDYLRIGILWAVGVAILLFGNYCIYVSVAGILANAGIMLWTYGTYMYAFRVAADKYSLNMPDITIIGM